MLEDQENEKESLCNKCGNSVIKYMDEEKEIGNAYGLNGAKVSGGYLSDSLEDLMTYKFNICEECLHEMFLNFAIPPKISTYMM